MSRGRITATAAAVGRWAERFGGRQVPVAVEACTGWLFVCDTLVASGAVAHLAEPVETRARCAAASAGPRPDRIEGQAPINLSGSSNDAPRWRIRVDVAYGRLA